MKRRGRHGQRTFLLRVSPAMQCYATVMSLKSPSRVQTGSLPTLITRLGVRGVRLKLSFRAVKFQAKSLVLVRHKKAVLQSIA
jgi:hypothetical protein